MKNKFELYICDTETTGLSIDNDIIELSLLRVSDGEQKTWCLKPLRTDNIQSEALRVNGHQLDDLLHKTKYGVERYLPAEKAIVEIENWLSEDMHSSDERTIVGQSDTRIIVGQNVSGFDRDMLIALWKKCNSIETFPFNKKYVIDTMLIEFFMDFCKGDFAEGYSLYALTKKYGIKNEKAHSARADAKATFELFNKQLDNFKNCLKSR